MHVKKVAEGLVDKGFQNAGRYGAAVDLGEVVDYSLQGCDLRAYLQYMAWEGCIRRSCLGHLSILGYRAWVLL